jgi:hypothetical protein
MMTGAVIVAVAIVGVFRVVARWIIVAHRGDARVVVLLVVSRVILALTTLIIHVVVGAVIVALIALIIHVVVGAVIFPVSTVPQHANIVNTAGMFPGGCVMMEGFEGAGQRRAP